MDRLRGFALLALGYAIILELLLVSAVIYWPDFEENISALKLVAPLPMLKQLVGEMEQGGAFAYVAGQQFFKGCNTVGTIAAVLFAVGAVAGEAYRGTLELWLSQPRSRLRLLSARWVGGALALTLPIFLTSASVPWLGDTIDESFELRPLMLGCVHVCALLLLIYSITFFFSCLGSNPVKIAICVLLLTAFEFALYFVKRATQTSIYRLSDLHDFLQIELTGRLDWYVLGPLYGASLLFYVAAVLVFRRRVP